MPKGTKLMSSTLDHATLMPKVMLYGMTRSQTFLLLWETEIIVKG